MQNFLVVSYDSDEQQWFYDTVRANTADDATGIICRMRPYVMDADATDFKELGKMATHVKNLSPRKIQKQLDAIAVEAGYTAQCQNCEKVYTTEELEEIEHYSERVSPGEEEPLGQCPDAECGAVCHLIPGAEV